MRPWEFYVLDHPSHPLTLKVSYGGEAAAEGGPPEWSRQIVRIDFPEDDSIETKLAEDCRVRVPGIYFELDSDVLNPASGPRVRWLADLLRRQPAWTVTIEGHTDSIGDPQYNLDLSGRRAASLKRALVGEHGVADGRLATAGFGPSRPLEPNATPRAGRATAGSSWCTPLLDTAWPKLTSTKAAFGALLNGGVSDLRTDRFALLSDRSRPADELLRSTGVGHDWERLLSSAFIASGDYGTRSSTVVLVARDGSVSFVERSFGPGGVPAGQVSFELLLEVQPARR